MPRFVLLEHRWDGVHWDVMLERGEVLCTWALDAPIVEGEEQPARGLPDHRLAYLDYEGPVSGDRGEVRRVAGGSYEEEIWRDDLVRVALDSPQLSGSAMFSRTGGAGWSFRFVGKLD